MTTDTDSLSLYLVKWRLKGIILHEKVKQGEIFSKVEEFCSENLLCGLDEIVGKRKNAEYDAINPIF